VPRWFRGMAAKARESGVRDAAPPTAAPPTAALPAATPPAATPPAATPPAAAPLSAEPARPPARARSWRARLRWLGYLVGGVAGMAGAGYLVAALWLFPAPLLPSERQVARVLGLEEAEAMRELQRTGLTAMVASREPHTAANPGSVIWQDPPPGVATPRGSTVELTVSTGARRVAVPDVQGLDQELATRLILAAGLRVDGIDSVTVQELVPGVALGTLPAAGDSLPLGRGVTLRLAR